MIPQEIILKKRDGRSLSREELRAFLDGYLRGEVGEAQMSAFLMATFFRGMTFDETVDLTALFIDSGTRLDLSAVPGTKVDKHSTGGVGDKTTLLVAPIAAAAGVPVPMISGRGLGHTGGTLDKLESIPGFKTDLDPPTFVRALRATGIAIAGQSDQFVPLDRRIYAVRDVTGTVEILPFIAASIMSKKIAGGADALVLDVKTGAGAFMREEEQAKGLAELLCRVGAHFGLPTSGFITRMDEPLGRAVGTWLEVVEAVDCLKGMPSPDLMEVVEAVAGGMIMKGGKGKTLREGIARAREVLRNGQAYETFCAFVQEQGGDLHYIEETLRYPAAKCIAEVVAEEGGYVAHVDARSIGLLAQELGAGRTSLGEGIDPTAGIVLLKKRGDMLEPGETLCRLYSSRHRSLHAFRGAARRAYRITRERPGTASNILWRFDENGVMQRIDEQEKRIAEQESGC